MDETYGTGTKGAGADSHVLAAVAVDLRFAGHSVLVDGGGLEILDCGEGDDGGCAGGGSGGGSYVWHSGAVEEVSHVRTLYWQE